MKSLNNYRGLKIEFDIVMEKISPRLSCLQEKDSRRGVIPPFGKGRKGGISQIDVFNYYETFDKLLSH
jgi:hypothetical protein